MNDNDDGFQLLTREQCVMIGCALIGIVAALYGEDTPKHRPHSAAGSKVPCATSEQYGPGERWSRPTTPSYSSKVEGPAALCAGAAFNLPNAMTTPVRAK